MPNNTTYASDVYMLDVDRSGYRRSTSPVLINKPTRPVKPPTDVDPTPPTPEPIGITCAGATETITIELIMSQADTGHTLRIRDLNTTYDDGSSEVILSLSGYQVTGDSLADNLTRAFSSETYSGLLVFADQSPIAYNSDNFTLSGVVEITSRAKDLRIGIELLRMDDSVNPNLSSLNVVEPSTPTYTWIDNDADNSRYSLSACISGVLDQ